MKPVWLIIGIGVIMELDLMYILLLRFFLSDYSSAKWRRGEFTWNKIAFNWSM